MKLSKSNRLLNGALIGLTFNVGIGIIYGLVISNFMDRTYSGPPTESFMVVVAIFPLVLIISGGPIVGALVGFITSGSSLRKRGILTALIAGLTHGFLASLSTGVFEFYNWAHYSLMAIASALICNLVVYRDTFGGQQNHRDSNTDSEK